MGKIGIFFGPEKGSVDKVAHIVAQTFGLDKSDVISVNKAKTTDFDKYSKIIFGISTVGRNNWDNDNKGNDWDIFAPQLKEINFSGKSVAIFGLGDQLTYPEHFVNAIAWLAERLEKCGVEVVGACPNKGYRFDDSEALKNGSFIGLPIDEDNEPELTQERVNQWCGLLKNDFGF